MQNLKLVFYQQFVRNQNTISISNNLKITLFYTKENPRLQKKTKKKISSFVYKDVIYCKVKLEIFVKERVCTKNNFCLA